MLKRFVFQYRLGDTRWHRSQRKIVKVISAQDKRLATIHFQAQMDNDGTLRSVCDLEITE